MTAKPSPNASNRRYRLVVTPSRANLRTKPMRNPLPALLVCLLAGCGASTSADLPPPTPCADPVALPDRALSDLDIELLWGRDRSALRECGGKVAVIAAAGK